MEYGLAVSAVVLALLYVGMATFLYRSQRESLRVLVEAQLALSVAFVTVAVPLALDARWTSAAWALQGAALVWLAFRQQRKLALLAGVALQALSGVAYVEQSPVAAEWPIVNGYCLGALMLALAGFFSARLFDPARERQSSASVAAGLAREAAFDRAARVGVRVVVLRRVHGDRAPSSTRTISRRCSCSRRRRRCLRCCSRRASRGRGSIGSALPLWPFAAFFAAVALFAIEHPAEDFGWLAWPIVVAAMCWFLREREALFPRLRGALHATAYWLLDRRSSCGKRTGSSTAPPTASGRRPPCSRSPRR